MSKISPFISYFCLLLFVLYYTAYYLYCKYAENLKISNHLVLVEPLIWLSNIIKTLLLVNNKTLLKIIDLKTDQNGSNYSNFRQSKFHLIEILDD